MVSLDLSSCYLFLRDALRCHNTTCLQGMLPRGQMVEGWRMVVLRGTNACNWWMSSGMRDRKWWEHKHRGRGCQCSRGMVLQSPAASNLFPSWRPHIFHATLSNMSASEAAPSTSLTSGDLSQRCRTVEPAVACHSIASSKAGAVPLFQQWHTLV